MRAWSLASFGLLSFASLVSLVCTACEDTGDKGWTKTPASADISDSGASAIPVVALHGVSITRSGALGPDSSKFVDLAANGVVRTKSGVVFKFVGNTVVDPSGALVFSVSPDGKLDAPGRPGFGTIDTADDVTFDDAKLHVRDDGVVEASFPGQPPSVIGIQFEHFVPEGRRAAVLTMIALRATSPGGPSVPAAMVQGAAAPAPAGSTVVGPAR